MQRQENQKKQREVWIARVVLIKKLINLNLWLRFFFFFLFFFCFFFVFFLFFFVLFCFVLFCFFVFFVFLYFCFLFFFVFFSFFIVIIFSLPVVLFFTHTNKLKNTKKNSTLTLPELMYDILGLFGA